ncbi:fatty acid--CoA ligase [Paraburkholderia kururiensis]
MTLDQLLMPAVEQYPEREIVYRDNLRLRYRDLHGRVLRLCALLQRLGAGPGVTVAVADWDSHRYLEAYFAVPMTGATLMTANIRLSPEQLAYTLGHCGASVLLVNDDFAPQFAALREALPMATSWLRLTDQPNEPAHPDLPWHGEYEACLAAETPDPVLPALNENWLATLFYTTGTTGVPKGVSFSHRQLVLHTLALAGALGCSADGPRLHRRDVYMPITPMFHVHAWGMPYLATMLGLKQVYPGRYRPTALLDLIEREGVSFSHCVPTLLQMMLNDPSQPQRDLSRWKVIIGGAALSESLARRALALGIDIWSGYGMSETGPVLTLAQLHPDHERNEARDLAARLRAGSPIPLVRLRVLDKAGQPVARDNRQPGEVTARAPWLTADYLNEPEASAGLWRNGFLHTRDIGVLDAAGSLRLTDRATDMIKTGGEWVSSLELEALLLDCAGVADAAVVGIPDARWGERPVAVVVPTKDNDPELAEALRKALHAHAQQGRLPSYALPDAIHLTHALPRTSVGKTDKKSLRIQYG